MPKPKRNRMVTKQNKQLATRLMQISLLVDDYIYKKKPISQRSAEGYIKEISAYKDQSHHDARSLQVIEKLICVMKGIINEQQELQVVTEDVYPCQDILASVPNGMISPVYSLVDEDMTELAQYLEKDKTPQVELKKRENISKNYYDDDDYMVVSRNPIDIENEETKANRNQIVLSNNKLQTTIYDNTDSEVIDLCNDDIDEILNQDFRLDIECEFNQDIQHAISNLNIKGIEAFTSPPFSQECSQSILDDHPTYNTTYSRPRNVLVPLTQDMNEVIKSATIAQQKPASGMVLQDQLTKIALPIANGQFSANKAINKTVVQKSPTETAFNDRTTKIRLPTTKQNIQILVNKSVSNIKSQIEKNAIKHVQNAKTKNPRTKKNTNTNTKANVNLNKKIVNHSVTTAKNAHIKPTEKPKKVKASKAKTPQHTKTQQTNSQGIRNLTYHTYKVLNEGNRNDQRKVPIYNTVVDLSWIDNIRFVREIQSDEYESPTVENTFWEDHTLPCNWKEDDLNY